MMTRFWNACNCKYSKNNMAEVLLCWSAETGCELWTLLFLPGKFRSRANSLSQGGNPGKVRLQLGILALILSVSFLNFAFTEVFLSQTRITLQSKGSAAGKSFETKGRWMKQFLPHPREHTLLPWSQNTSNKPPGAWVQTLTSWTKAGDEREQCFLFKLPTLLLGSSFEISLVTPLVSSRKISNHK